MDQSFVPGYSFDFEKYTIGLIDNPNGEQFVYGQFSSISTMNMQNGIKLDSIGNLELSFLIDPPTNNAIFFSIKTSYGYLLHLHGGDGFRKIDEFGNIYDPNFQSNILTYFPSSLISTSMESYHYADDRILSGCSPSPCSYPATNPTSSFYLYRLLADGMYDTTFTHNTNGQITYVKSFGDSVVYISGNYTYYDTVSASKLVKTNLDGEIDTTFKSKFTWGEAYPAYLQNDGKLIVTGQFVFQGIPDTLGIVRVLPDGELDTTFNNDAVVVSYQNGIGYWTGLHSVCRTTDSGFLIGGMFSEYDNVPRGNIVKTDANGFVDLGYLNSTGIDAHPYPSLGIPPEVTSIVHGYDGKYYITGWYNSFNGQPVSPLIRLFDIGTGFSEPTCKHNDLLIYPNPANESITITLDDFFHGVNAQLDIYDVYGRFVESIQIGNLKTITNIAHLTNGWYQIKGMIAKRPVVSKFTKIE